ncbi:MULTISPECIES: hypothetical protein [unclassified Thalassospira]|uniref:hypothetical protein n=1 Tax=unclassified Thalassospira TaxID=2648997 RepID=UPI0007A9C702|nr:MULTISPECIES: hypothetical protein [unclassified Thalassospira]KZC99696.1 hypothetical protein AUQ41_08440 [Thalassospira sp. MCCC 1A02898]ONH85378.1 hypothetical protein TH47_05905 [Thalassospira sp. MCCC 1A02803]
MAKVLLKVVDGTGHQHAAEIALRDVKMIKARVLVGLWLIKLGCAVMSVRSESEGSDAAR